MTRRPLQSTRAFASATVARLAPWSAPLLILILPALLFRPGWGGNVAPFGGDVVVLNYPLLSLIQHQLQGGELPLWNNYAGGGYPLVPFSALPFYPPLWALRWLTIDGQITLLDTVHFALAGLGVYVLAGVTGASRTGRLIGALSFLLSGFLIAHLYAGHLFEEGVIAWMPWVFYAAHRLLARPSLRAAVLLGVVGGLQALANGIGFLVFTLYPVAALVLTGLIATWRRDRRAALRLLPLPPVSAAVAAGLAAVIILPFLQVLGQSLRSGGLDYGGASLISLPPAALLAALSPDAVGNGLHDSYWLDQFTAGYWHEFALYMGLLPPLTALAAALYCRGRPWVRFYLALALGGLLLALGRYTSLYSLLASLPFLHLRSLPAAWQPSLERDTSVYGLAFHLPLLNLVRVPARWLLACTLGVSVLAGSGTDWLLAQRQGIGALWRALRAPLLVIAAPTLLVLAALQVLYMQGGHGGASPFFAATVWPAAQRLLLYGGILALILACGADGLIRQRAVALLLVAFTLLDLWTAASPLVGFLDPGQYYRPTTVSSMLRAGSDTYRVLTIDRSMPNRQGMVDRSLYDAEDFAPVTLYPYWAVSHPWAFKGHYDISNADARDLFPCYDQGGDDLLGISQITVAAPLSARFPLCPPYNRPTAAPVLRGVVATEYWLLPNGHSWNPTPFLGTTYVYRNPTALPRAFLVPASAARTLAQPIDQRIAATNEHFDGRRVLVLDPHIAAAPLGLDWLQRAWSAVLAPAPHRLPANLAPGAARLLDDSSNSVQVAVNATADSYLVLDDAYYPGWQVTLDGAPAPIRRADYLLRAVRVGPGAHRLVFTYAPLSYLAGALITMLTALGVSAYLGWASFRNRSWRRVGR